MYVNLEILELSDARWDRRCTFIGILAEKSPGAYSWFLQF